MDLSCGDCGSDSLDVPKDMAKDGAPCGVCGSRNTKVLR